MANTLPRRLCNVHAGGGQNLGPSEAQVLVQLDLQATLRSSAMMSITTHTEGWRARLHLHGMVDLPSLRDRASTEHEMLWRRQWDSRIRRSAIAAKRLGSPGAVASRQPDLPAGRLAA